VGGKVTPVLIKEHPLEVWRIDGMRFSMSDHDPERSLTLANRIEPGVAQLQLILDGEDFMKSGHWIHRLEEGPPDTVS